MRAVALLMSPVHNTHLPFLQEGWKSNNEAHISMLQCNFCSLHTCIQTLQQKYKRVELNIDVSQCTFHYFGIILAGCVMGRWIP